MSRIPAHGPTSWQTPVSRKLQRLSTLSGYLTRSAAAPIQPSLTRYWGLARKRVTASTWVLETHAHADHLTAADLIRKRTGAKIACGRGICSVQENFARVFNMKKRPTMAASSTGCFRMVMRLSVGQLKIQSSGNARPYCGQRDLSRQRRRVYWRYAFCTGIWDGALRFPGWGGCTVL